jgi:polyphosphate kinase 2 (PPK2 family)
MLTNVDLSREVAKAEYKRLKDDTDLKLADLQRQVKALGIPVIIVFEGWSASGKGTLINRLILPLDPGDSVSTAQAGQRKRRSSTLSCGGSGKGHRRGGVWPSSIGVGIAVW